MRTILLATSIISLSAAEALAASIESVYQPAPLSAMQSERPLPTDMTTIQPHESLVPGYNEAHRQNFRMLNFGL